MRKKYFFLLFPLLTLILGACGDKDLNPDPIPEDGERVEVTLSTSIPDLVLSSRTMSEQYENRIEDLDILVFVVDGSEEKYAYRTHSTSDLTNSGGSTFYFKTSMFLILVRTTSNTAWCCSPTWAMRSTPY